jgi:hypothetical protein
MHQPPQTLDGAKVLAVADLGGSTATGRTVHMVDGEIVVTPAALAIAEYEGESGVYLFYCDPEWGVVTDTFHESVDSAVEQAQWEYTDVVFVGVTGQP